VIEKLQRRARERQARLAVRAWEYRQRNLAHGVWFRLRRVLADAETAWAIPADEAARLVAEGFPAEAVGRQLEPAKTIVFVPAERAARLAGARQIKVRLDADLLGAEALALVRFPR
jgi:hypothetical protein